MAYNVNFIGGMPVVLPKVAPLLKGKGHIINYRHHSVIMNKKRKFAFFSASNINGTAWKNIVRKGIFKKDERAVSAGYQPGNELYNAIKASGLRPNDKDPCYYLLRLTANLQRAC